MHLGYILKDCSATLRSVITEPFHCHRAFSIGFWNCFYSSTEFSRTSISLQGSWKHRSLSDQNHNILNNISQHRNCVTKSGMIIITAVGHLVFLTYPLHFWTTGPSSPFWLQMKLCFSGLFFIELIVPHVQIRNKCSTSSILQFGVQQGNVLGPVLVFFSIYFVALLIIWINIMLTIIPYDPQMHVSFKGN